MGKMKKYLIAISKTYSLYNLSRLKELHVLNTKLLLVYTESQTDKTAAFFLASSLKSK